MTDRQRSAPSVGASLRCRLSPSPSLLEASVVARGIAFVLLAASDGRRVALPPALGPRGAELSLLARVGRALGLRRGEHAAIEPFLAELEGLGLLRVTPEAIELAPFLDGASVEIEREEAYPPGVSVFRPPANGHTPGGYPPSRPSNGHTPGGIAIRRDAANGHTPGGIGVRDENTPNNACARAVTGSSSLDQPPPPTPPSPRARDPEADQDHGTGTLESSGYRDRIGTLILRARELEGAAVSRLVAAVDGIGATKGAKGDELVDATRGALAELAIKVATAEKAMTIEERSRYLLRCVTSSIDRVREGAKKSGSGTKPRARQEGGDVDLAFELERVRRLTEESER